MNKNIFQLNRILLLSIGLFLFSLFLFPYNVRAVNVPLSHAYQYSNMTLSNTRGDQGPARGEIYAVDYISINLTKEFNLANYATGSILAQTDTVVSGTTISSGASYTTGSYNFAGGMYGTPYLNGQTAWEYRRGSSTHEAFDKDAWIPFVGGIADYWDYYLTSSNPAAVSCSGKTCTASGNGSSTITVNWYNTRSDIYPYYSVYRGAATFQPVMYNCNKTDWVPTVPIQTGYDDNGEYQFITVDTGWGDNGYSTFIVGSASYYQYGGQWVTSNGPFCTNDGDSDMVYSPERVGSSGFTPAPLYYTITSVLPDNPPIISNIQSEGVGYNDVKISWNYSDADGDTQTWWNTQISSTLSFGDGDIIIWSGEPQVGSVPGAGVKISNDTSTDFFPQNRGKLGANTTYYTRVQVGNAKAGTGWVTGPSFTTKAYPALTVDYKINNIDSKNVSVKTGDNVNIVWNITDADGGIVDGLVPDSCSISSVGFDAINGTGLSLSSSKGAIVPKEPIDKTYQVNLSCAAKPGGTAVNETIALTVISQPLLSCTITGKVVSTENPVATISGLVDNAIGPYIWKYKRQATEPYIAANGNKPGIDIPINYAGVGLGKYTPLLEVTAGGKTVEKACSGDVTNLGNRSIREVAP